MDSIEELIKSKNRKKKPPTINSNLPIIHYFKDEKVRDYTVKCWNDIIKESGGSQVIKPRDIPVEVSHRIFRQESY